MPIVAEVPSPLPDPGLVGPGRHCWSVTPSDADELVRVARALRVGSTAGNLAVVSLDGVTTVIPNVQVGETIIGLFKQVKSTSTTATGITAFA
jgi:hypothetical protein